MGKRDARIGVGIERPFRRPRIRESEISNRPTHPYTFTNRAVTAAASDSSGGTFTSG